MSEIFYTYLILTKNDTLYCGYTNDIKQRYYKHLSGTGAKYTKVNKPSRLVYIESFDSKSNAMKRENEIKKLTRRDKLKIVELFNRTKNELYYKALDINKMYEQ
ncbi:GIY-YIG nuclease family protein [bacterium]|nr:GIY-YIG nuclease family protein [bacterium]